MNAPVESKRVDPPTLSDLVPPTASPLTGPRGPRWTPKQMIFFYSSEEWEEFICEWALALGEGYILTQRFGGPNDHSVDIAGFKTESGFEGEWHCYQCKHYAQPLGKADVLPEIIKVFRSVLAGHYVMPTRYEFVAPQGCGLALEK